jgi:uncharacterized membrane protein (UPF0136 family)
MNAFLGKAVVAYGVFLILIGVIGFLSNPEKAKTALLSGGTFGLLSAVWGVLVIRGARWARKAALATTVLLAGVFVWRAAVGWAAVAQGQSEKRTAAVLITVMLAGSLVIFCLLVAGRGKEWTAKTGTRNPT